MCLSLSQSYDHYGQLRNVSNTNSAITKERIVAFFLQKFEHASNQSRLRWICEKMMDLMSMNVAQATNDVA